MSGLGPAEAEATNSDGERSFATRESEHIWSAPRRRSAAQALKISGALRSRPC